MSRNEPCQAALDFMSDLYLQAEVGVGKLAHSAMYDENSLLVEFANVPNGRRGGADYHNNRFAVIVEGFERTDGKVKLSVLVPSHRTDKKLRGKTSKVKSVCKCLADYISMLSEIAPYYHCG